MKTTALVAADENPDEIELVILRAAQVEEAMGSDIKRCYEAAAEGLFTRPCKLSERASGWPRHEVEAIIAARIAGVSIDEIKELVQRLHAYRSELPQLRRWLGRAKVA